MSSASPEDKGTQDNVPDTSKPQESQSVESRPRSVENQSNVFGLVGTSPAIREVQGLVARFGPTNLSVLVTGETGTGKEVTIRALHKVSRLQTQKIVTFNCAAVTDEMMMSHLFGHERGSFTGAVDRNIGVFGLADGATLFLDEIGDMSLRMQAMVLRALQDGEIQIVGGKTRKINVRLLFATNQNLRTLVKEGRFREDLYHRINSLVIHIPPLRERRDDIPLFVSAFLSCFSIEFGKPTLDITPDVLRVLERYHWPGNVRELENTMRRAVLLTDTEQIGVEHLQAYLKDADGPSLKSFPKWPDGELPTLRELEQNYLKETIQRYGGNLKQAAKIAGMSRQTMRNKVERFQLQNFLKSARKR